MLTGAEDMEIAALRKQGWTVSAIARHVDRDRKTVRKYLNGDGVAGVRAGSTADPFDRVEPYVRQRLADDPHVWSTVLFDEVAALEYVQSYPTFTRKIRERELRPHCEPCAGVKGRATVDINHPPGEETQWDWLELSDTPWGEKAYVLVGALSFSGRFRVWFSESDDQAHLILGLDEVSRRLGGVTTEWRFDRMATVINPQTGKMQSSFMPVAKHYGVRVVACPPRRGNRKGVVEKAIHYFTQGWWRTADVGSPVEAQSSADTWCVDVADHRIRDIGENPGVSEADSGPVSGRGEPDTPPNGRVGRFTVAQAVESETLLALPPEAYPAEITLTRRVTANGLVSVWGNQYSTPPGLIGQEATVRWRVGTDQLDVISAAGMMAASHRLAPRGANRMVRLSEHAKALENVVLASFSSDRPCQRKVNRPPSEAALAIAAEITGDPSDGSAPVIDLDVYQQFIDNHQQKGGGR